MLRGCRRPGACRGTRTQRLQRNLLGLADRVGLSLGMPRANGGVQSFVLRAAFGRCGGRFVGHGVVLIEVAS